MVSDCIHCHQVVPHPWHDDGTINEASAFLWHTGQAYGTPIFYHKDNDYQ